VDHRAVEVLDGHSLGAAKSDMTNLFRSHPLLLYFALAFALFWACIGLGSIDRFHFWVPILGAFAPGVAAIVVSGGAGGEGEVRQLLGRLRQWRVGVGWYLVVLGLPFAEDLFAAGLASLRGLFSAARIPPVLPVLPALWVVFLFAAGEEVGWRGFALPRLLISRSAVAASLLLGTVHAAWHFPVILLPHQYLSGVPFVPWSIFVLSEAVIFTWIFRNTGGSVLMAALYHGSSNLGMILYGGIDPAWAPWIKCSTSTLTALCVLAWAGPNLKREPKKAA
jgi:membrane protease YdiL (CAAX protease family)